MCRRGSEKTRKQSQRQPTQLQHNSLNLAWITSLRMLTLWRSCLAVDRFRLNSSQHRDRKVKGILVFQVLEGTSILPRWCRNKRLYPHLLVQLYPQLSQIWRTRDCWMLEVWDLLSLLQQQRRGWITKSLLRWDKRKHNSHSRSLKREKHSRERGRKTSALSLQGKLM